MLPHRIAVALLISGASLTTAAAADEAWSCNLSSSQAPIGTITLSDASYALVQPDGKAGTGALSLEREIETVTIGPGVEETLVHVDDGPLRNAFGVHLGYLDERSDPAVLVFNIGVGAGIACTPAASAS
jgi:hypothetical protein